MRVGNRVKIIKHPNLPIGWSPTPRVGDIGTIKKKQPNFGWNKKGAYLIRFIDNKCGNYLRGELKLLDSQLLFNFMYEKED